MVVSGFFRLFAFVCLPSFVFYLLPGSAWYFICVQVICLQSCVCLSGGVRFLLHHDFICVSCLYLSLFFCSLCVFLLFQNQITFYYDFMRFTNCLPLVSQLSPRLSHFFVSDRNALAKQKSKPCGMKKCCLWFIFMLFSISIEMDQKLPASGTSNTSNMHTHTGCNGYEITVWVLQGCNHFWIWSRVWDALPETGFHSILH